MHVPCHFCKKSVDADAEGNYQFVTGWVEKRKGGGAHAVALRTPVARFAHGSCIDKERLRRELNLSPDQTQLL